MLASLIAGAVTDATARRNVRGLAEVESAALQQTEAIDALSALSPSQRVKIIAEVKRASPSKGALATISDPAGLARRYVDGGASAVSVLTEQRRFAGSLGDLEAVRAAIAVPVLRKDFIVLPYQIFEARASGADLVLLMVSALAQPELAQLLRLTEDLGMNALVETHDADELSRAVDVGAKIIGVNARNLDTFELDRDLFGSLSDRIPAGTVRVAESAVTCAADVAHYREAGADVVLVGEALVTSDPEATLAEFLAA